MNSPHSRIEALARHAGELERNPGDANAMAGLRDIFVEVYYPPTPMEMSDQERESITSSIAGDMAQNARQLASTWDTLTSEQLEQASESLEDSWRELIVANHHLVREWAEDLGAQARQEIIAMAAKHAAMSHGEVTPDQMLTVICDGVTDMDSDVFPAVAHTLKAKGIATIYAIFAGHTLREELAQGDHIDFPRNMHMHTRDPKDGPAGHNPAD